MKNKDVKPLVLIPIVGIPDIHPGDALNKIIEHAILDQGDELVQGDIVVITQKIVSKSEEKNNKSIAIVTHGGPIKALFREFFQLGEFKEINVCALIEINKDGHSFEVVAMDGAELK